MPPWGCRSYLEKDSVIILDTFRTPRDKLKERLEALGLREVVSGTRLDAYAAFAGAHKNKLKTLARGGLEEYTEGAAGSGLDGTVFVPVVYF